MEWQLKVLVVALRDWWLLGALLLFSFFVFSRRRLSSSSVTKKSALPLKISVDISSSFKGASAQGISGY